MRKYSIFISIITLILGFTFYGEPVSIMISKTEYNIAAEVLCFAAWLFLTLFIQAVNLKRYLSRNEA